MFHQLETGHLDFQWMREYGSTWRIRTFFGVSLVRSIDCYSKMLTVNCS